MIVSAANLCYFRHFTKEKRKNYSVSNCHFVAGEVDKMSQ